MISLNNHALLKGRIYKNMALFAIPNIDKVSARQVKIFWSLGSLLKKLKK